MYDYIFNHCIGYLLYVVKVISLDSKVGEKWLFKQTILYHSREQVKPLTCDYNFLYFTRYNLGISR